MTVKLFMLKDGVDVHVGDFSVNGYIVKSAPASILDNAKSIMDRVLQIPAMTPDGSITSTDDPQKWIENIHRTVSGRYLRATKPAEETETKNEARKETTNED